MSTISSCPRCQRQVSIPAGVDSQAEVRCPLCDAEYPLSEALALTPPELIPVLSAVRQESALTPKRSEALAAVDRGEASEPVATIPFGGAVESAETLAHEAETVAEEEEVNEAAAVAVRTRGDVTVHLRRRETSPLGRLIGVVVGGLAGCAIAYYGLLPLIFWFKTPANTAQKSRGRPPVERFVKPEGANQKPPPAMAEPSREPSREPSPLSMPEQKDEKAAPPEKPSEPAAFEGATKETAPKTEAEPPRSPAGAAQ